MEFTNFGRLTCNVRKLNSKRFCYRGQSASFSKRFRSETVCCVHVSELKGWWRSADTQELDLEDEGRVRGDGAGEALVAVGFFGGDGELDLVADFHLGDAFVPTLDDLADAKDKVEGLIAIDGAVELLSVGQRAGVVDGDGLAFLRSDGAFFGFGDVIDLHF